MIRMSQQPNLFSSSPQNGSITPDRKPVPHPPSRMPLWLRRIELFFSVVVRIYIGVIVIVLPWTPMWASNSVFNYFPQVSDFMMYGAVRGIVSGLGFINLWIAVDEAIHYRETLPKQ